MKKLIPLLFLGCTLGAWAEIQESDATYFHPAASMYIHGDQVGASNLVVKGLSVFPDNGKLKRLKELLDQQKDEQQQDQENQDQQNQENQDQQEQNQDQQDDQQQDPKEQDQQDDQQDQSQEEQQEEQDAQQEPPRAEQMSQDEAERLLDAMKQEEEAKRLQLHPVMGAPVKVDKDW